MLGGYFFTELLCAFFCTVEDLVIEAEYPFAEGFLTLDGFEFRFPLELFRGFTFSSIRKLPPFFYFDFEVFALVPVEDLESDFCDLDLMTNGIMAG